MFPVHTAHFSQLLTFLYLVSHWQKGKEKINLAPFLSGADLGFLWRSNSKSYPKHQLFGVFLAKKRKIPKKPFEAALLVDSSKKNSFLHMLPTPHWWCISEPTPALVDHAKKTCWISRDCYIRFSWKTLPMKFDPQDGRRNVWSSTRGRSVCLGGGLGLGVGSAPAPAL